VRITELNFKKRFRNTLQNFFPRAIHEVGSSLKKELSEKGKIF